jgi:pimeloyl-ACP methyl ester carboxylesterase
VASVTVATDDGRDLEVVVGGPDDADALVFHHGTPGGALVPPGFEDAAARHGLRIVVHSRPGYGESTPQPGRRVADVAADTASVLDALGIDRFLALGWSGGGPHALACAALLPERCLAAGAIAAVAPYDLFGAGWMDGMGQDNIDEFSAAVAGREALEGFLARFDRSSITREGLLADIGTLFSPVDIEAFAGPLADYMVDGMRHAVRHGTDGWRDDDLAFARPWGFDPTAIEVPVVMWQGRQDRMVPFAHGEWLAAAVPAARARLSDEQGHVSLMTHPDELVAEVVSLLR